MNNKTVNVFYFTTIRSLLQPFMVIFFVLLLFLSCKDDGYSTLSKDTVIVYMVADNDLSNVTLNNINEMESAFTDESKNLIVYIDLGHEESRIIKISHDESEQIASETIIAYPDQNSASPTVLNAVIKDIIDLYPSESYGLILWSHGTGWLPSPKKRTKSFGRDGYFEMDIKDLEVALPDKTFDYIIFDACLMGSIEVAYQLRNKTKYILASPTEILANGFPYQDIVSPLFASHKNVEQKLKGVAIEYMSHYNAQSGKNQSASISLIQTDALDELVLRTRALLNAYNIQQWEYHHHLIQRLDILENTLTFDFLDFLYHNYPDVAVATIEHQLNKAVLYKGHTDEFIGIYQINNFSGLSCYVPQVEYGELNSYYQTLPWCRDSGFDMLFTSY